MGDLQETLRAIDAATGCQQCEGPLGDSPSGDFCSETCAELWSSRHAVPLDEDDSMKFAIQLPCYGPRSTLEGWISAEYKAIWLEKLPTAEWEPVYPDNPCTWEWVDPGPWLEGTISGILCIQGRVRRINPRGPR